MPLHEKIRYWFWKQWLLASFPLDSPVRFIVIARIAMVYDPAFDTGGIAAVKRLHVEHLADMEKKQAHK